MQTHKRFHDAIGPECLRERPESRGHVGLGVGLHEDHLCDVVPLGGSLRPVPGRGRDTVLSLGHCQVVCCL